MKEWVVPTGANAEAPPARITLTQANNVQLTMPFHVSIMNPMEAEQLSAALHEASIEAERARARSR